MFVVIGSRKCDRKGPNGSLEGNDVLSYCNKDGLMMNIVRADGDKMNENIPNGNLVAAKYGFTTEYLISLARECQEKFQLHKSESINSSSHTSSFNKSTLADTANHTGCDCPFNLPVCDTRIPEIWKRIEKHDDIVIACREAGNLAIWVFFQNISISFDWKHQNRCSHSSLQSFLPASLEKKFEFEHLHFKPCGWSFFSQFRIWIWKMVFMYLPSFILEIRPTFNLTWTGTIGNWSTCVMIAFFWNTFSMSKFLDYNEKLFS